MRYDFQSHKVTFRRLPQHENTTIDFRTPTTDLFPANDKQPVIGARAGNLTFVAYRAAAIVRNANIAKQTST